MSEVESLIDRALAEDLCAGDATTEALIPPDLRARATLTAKANGVLAGVDVALAVFRRVDPTLEITAFMTDGSALNPKDVVASIEGRAAFILQAERTALNFLQRLSGIATQARTYVDAVEGYKARIVDTRKTTPGLRALEKYAVRMGGGSNHRRNLGDGVLVKDNHIQALRHGGLDLKEIIRRAQANAPHVARVEVEVTDLCEVRDALDAGAQILLLDNMPVDEMAEAVRLIDGRAITEASGGIGLETVRAVAGAGVDLISVGALTHSASALDISLEMLSGDGPACRGDSG